MEFGPRQEASSSSDFLLLLALRRSPLATIPLDDLEAMISSGINLVMTVIGFAVSTMFIVFVCTRLICARIHLSASRRSFPTASRADLSILERGINGLEPVVVASFPTRKFGDSPSSDTQCTVCLAEYQEKDVQRVLPYCGHTFHVHCIDIWLKQHPTCPVCRISLRDSPERKRGMMMMPAANRSAFLCPPGNLDPNSYHCLQTSRGYSSASSENWAVEPLYDSRPVSELPGSREAVAVAPTMSELQCISECGKKHMESPSNC